MRWAAAKRGWGKGAAGFCGRSECDLCVAKSGVVIMSCTESRWLGQQRRVEKMIAKVKEKRGKTQSEVIAWKSAVRYIV